MTTSDDLGEPAGVARDAVASVPSLADDLLDELLPETFDWRAMVRRYPLPALGVAALGGFLVGRSKGTAVLGALSGLATTFVTANLAGLVDDGGG